MQYPISIPASAPKTQQYHFRLHCLRVGDVKDKRNERGL